jgi:hypothetical protein
MLVGTAVDYFTTKKNELNHGNRPEHWTEDPHLRSLASGTAFHIPLPGPHVPNIPLPPTRPKEPEAKGREKRRGKKGDSNKQGVGPISLRRYDYFCFLRFFFTSQSKSLFYIYFVCPLCDRKRGQVRGLGF